MPRRKKEVEEERKGSAPTGEGAARAESSAGEDEASGTGASPKAKAVKKKAASRGSGRVVISEELAAKGEQVKDKRLVIVESPAKSKTINKILGDGYYVTSSMGHVRDLPVRPRAGDIGVDIEDNFTPRYKILNKKKELVKDLKYLADQAKEVLLASDPDREGEAIAWHLVSALDLPEKKYKRITFNEITKDAVLEALKKPRDIAMDLVNAQQARRIIDRIVGYKLSPLLWEKIATRLSAGRVQSVALKFIVDREREIRAFKPEEYWLISADFKTGEITFNARLARADGKTIEIKNRAEVERILEELKKSDFIAASVTAKERLDRPYPPFTTSLLQQRASTELGFTSKRTMMLAQRLYEGVNLGEAGPTGLITYMRTDSMRIASSALAQARQFINENFGKQYLPDAPNMYKTKSKGAQEAHECIRPTHIEYTPESIKKHLDNDQYRLYSLIWRRFIACQMTPAVYNVTEVVIKAGKYEFVARGRELKFDGYFKVYRTKTVDEEQQLPAIEKGTKFDLPAIKPVQKFTEPPPRYSEASLVKALEKNGIGRPSTYVPTLTTIQSRGYVIAEGRQLIPTELGFLVTENLEKHMASFVDSRFTAEMEAELDKVEEGKADWVKILDSFYKDFEKELAKAARDMVQIRDTIDGRCDKCGSGMIVSWNRNGKKYVCSKQECGNQKFSPASIVKGELCERCSSEMVIKLGRFGKFMACSKYPECKFTKTILRGDRVVRVPDGQMPNCPGFEACAKFPDCAYTVFAVRKGRAPAEPEAKPTECPKCGGRIVHRDCGKPMLVRYTRRGPFLGCSQYPNCRGIGKIPKEWIVELVKVSDKLEQEEAEEKEEV